MPLDYTTLRIEIDVIRESGSELNRSALTGSRNRLTRWADRFSSKEPRPWPATTMSCVENAILIFHDRLRHR